MVLSTVVDSNVLSHLVLIITKEQGAVIGRGGTSPQTSGEAEPALSRRARQSQSSVVRARSVVAFLSDRKRQRSMVISFTSLDIPVLGHRQ